MEYKGALIAVSDVKKSTEFYCRVLGMKVDGDFGANVQLSGGLFLQTADTWQGFIGGRPIQLGHNAGELYFEERDMDGFFSRLKEEGVEYVHEPLEHGWGQRAVRFYDPDRNVIEVAEALDMVIRRFIDGGMSTAQAAARMDVPEDYIIASLSSAHTQARQMTQE